MPADADTNCRVLVCDDVAGYRMLVRAVLSISGDLEVVGEAADGVEAIAAARLHQPDVVLLDVAMPELDGIEALPGILEASPRSRVVMLTGFATRDVRERAMAAGASEYLEKGLDPESIVAAVRRNCDCDDTPHER